MSRGTRGDAGKPLKEEGEAWTEALGAGEWAGSGAGRKGAAISRAGWGLDVGQPAAASAAAASPSWGTGTASQQEERAGHGTRGVGLRSPCLPCQCKARVLSADHVNAILSIKLFRVPPNPTQTATWGLFLVLNRWGS